MNTLHKQVNTEHVWSNFLLARKRAIEWMLEDGKSFTEISTTLSMDPAQVQLIHVTDEAEMKNDRKYEGTGCLIAAVILGAVFGFALTGNVIGAVIGVSLALSTAIIATSG